MHRKVPINKNKSTRVQPIDLIELIIYRINLDIKLLKVASILKTIKGLVIN